MTPVSHDTPREGVMYVHTGTDEIVEYLTRTDDGSQYVFSVAGGSRTLELDTEDWPAYREFLTTADDS